MSVHIIKAPAGLGKTTLTIEQIKNYGAQYARIEIYVPTLELAAEINEQLVVLDITSRIIKGRNKEVADGETMCRLPETAAEISKRGYPVFPILCMGRTNPLDIYSHTTCEYFQECAYLKQFEDKDTKVLIFTHAYLPLPRNVKEQIHPGLVIIDESFLTPCLLKEGDRNEITRGQLLALSYDSAPLQFIIKRLLCAIDNDEPILDSLRKDKITSNSLRNTLKIYPPIQPVGFLAISSDAEGLPRLKAKNRVRVEDLFAILIAELATSRSESHGITFNSEKQSLVLHYRKPITRFGRALRQPLIIGKIIVLPPAASKMGRPLRKPPVRRNEPPIIIIDANADLQLIRPWFPNATFQEIKVARHAYVIQCKSTRGSTTSLVPDKNRAPTSKKRAEDNIEGLQNLIERESESGKRKVLVVGPQSITGNSKDNKPGLLTPPQNGVLAHFNGLRGIDVYKDFDTVIIVGRNEPPIEELENLARSLFFDSETTLETGSNWVMEERPYRFRDPRKKLGVDVIVHPDRRIQRLLEQIREGESTQAIDRLRLIHATTPKRVILVSNIPLDLVVDEVVDFKTLLYQTRLDQAWAKLRGVLPLNPEWMSKTRPDLWPTPGAARTDLRVADIDGHFINIVSISNLTILNFDYWVAGQKCPSRAISILPAAETMNELSRLLGLPVGLPAAPVGLHFESDPPGHKCLVGVGGALLAPLRASGAGFSDPP